MEALPSEELLFLLAKPFLRYQHYRPSSEMERFVEFVLTRFSTAVVITALSWLCWRSYMVLSKPSEELISLLGLEVPVPPALSLAGIRADGIILNWKPPEQQKNSVVKHSINVNGITVGELSPQDTSIAITGLKPDHNYIIRLVAVNFLNFQALSDAIRVQTKPASSHDFFQNSNDHEGTPEDNHREAVPRIQPCKNLVEVTPAPPPAMHREHSGSVSHPKRGGRRVSPVIAPGSLFGDNNESERDGVGLRELTEKLDRFRMEIDAAEQDLAKEEEEFESGHVSLNKQRNDLKQAVTDKENASKSLKKQVADLAGQNSAAQSRKLAAEKQLQQKMQERQKLRDDVDRWDREISTMHTDAERFDEERVKYREGADTEIIRLKEEQTAQSVTNKALEDALRQTRTKIEALKSEREQLEHDEPEVAHNPQLVSQSEDAEWNSKLFLLQSQYHAAYQRLQQAREYGNQAATMLEAWRQRRASQPHMFANTPVLEFVAPGRRHSQRRSRALSLRNDPSPHGTTFDMANGPPYNSSISSISPPFSSASPFFNVVNGMSFPALTGPSLPVEQMANGMSPSEIEFLTAGAPTSPSVAGALLPAGLLGDEDQNRFAKHEPSSSRSSPANGNILPGLGAPQTLEQPHGPSSPVSPASRSPSVFASPRESSTHLPMFNNRSDSIMDSDRRSVRSAASSMRALSGNVNTTTRFANLFGFNRQRGKTFSDEGPALGSLRSAESQSFPRDTSDQVPMGRRRGSHSGTWMGQMQSVLTRNSDPIAGATNAPASRRRFINVFGSKQDATQSGDISEHPQSRPESTASSETNNMLPKPSADTHARFGWPVSGDSFIPRHATTLGPDWGTAAAWSRHPSRRPSITYGSSHHTPMESPFLDDDLDFQPTRRSPKLAPIGTRPASQVSTGSGEKPRLNPAAPSFKIKTVFTREKKGEKGEKVKSKKEKEKERDSTSSIPELLSTDFTTPTHKDLAHSNNVAGKSRSTISDTASEPRDSLERTTSRTPSEYAGTPKETFMQKLTRKSSATMFNFPGFRGKKTSVQGNDHAGTPDETDEEGTSLRPDGREKMSKSFESEKGIAGGLSPLMTGRDSKEKDRSSGGFSFRSLKGRRKGEKTPSLHESVTSEMGEEEEGEVENEWTQI